MDELTTAVSANQRRGTAMNVISGVVIAMFVTLLGALIGHPWIALLLGAAAGIAAVVVSSAGAEEFVIKRAGALAVARGDEPRLHNVVEGLCASAGVPEPALYVVADDGLNAFAAGRDANSACLVVTRGLLDGLSRIELEGVVAHELSHIKRLDIRPWTVAAGLFGRLAPAAIPRLAGERCEGLADVSGVALTRYPPGLISALEKVRDNPGRTSDPVIAHLWLQAPTQPTHPPLEERIQALREL